MKRVLITGSGPIGVLCALAARAHGARVTEIPVRHHARRFGHSKYGIGRVVRVVLDLLILVFMDRALDRPIRWTVDEVFLALKRPDGSPLKRLARWKLPAKGAIRLEDGERYVSRPVQLPLPGLFSN